MMSDLDCSFTNGLIPSPHAFTHRLFIPTTTSDGDVLASGFCLNT